MPELEEVYEEMTATERKHLSLLGKADREALKSLIGKQKVTRSENELTGETDTHGKADPILITGRETPLSPSTGVQDSDHGRPRVGCHRLTLFFLQTACPSALSSVKMWIM
ncbi:MAG: hypothetical protein U5L96_16000 [Owenweeksia sp.]|nr:hypothetical protein [Owenweeksia sp.]